MKIILLFVTACAAIGVSSGCTQQQRASSFGGTADIEIPAGQKLVNVTWDNGDDLWYLVRPMKAGESAETYTLLEQSSFGKMQGKVLLHEHPGIEK